MSTAQHTPGPWPFQTVKTQSGICHKVGLFPWKQGQLNSACIYVDYPSNGPIEAELLANARLMAAAPELFKACEAIIRYQELIESDASGQSQGLIQAYAEAFEGSVEAVAKARGQA